MPNDIRITLSIEQDSSKVPDYSGVFDEKSAVYASLKETLSGPYEIRVELYTLRPLSRAEFIALAGRRALVTITSDNVGVRHGVRQTRYAAGVVSGISCGGKIQSDLAGKKDSWWYTVTLVSPFEQLRRSVLTRSFVNKGAADVIKELMGEAGIEAVLDESLINRNSFDPNVIYTQAHESTWGFMHRLMVLYGINYAFVHVNDCSPLVYLSRGSGLAVCRCADPGISSADWALNSDDASVIGCSLYSGTGLSLRNFVSSRSNQPLEEDPAALQAEFLCTREDSGVAKAKDLSRIRENLEAIRKRSQLEYKGTGSSLSLCPGAVISVSDFYGEEPFKALVYRTESLVQATVSDTDRALSPVFSSEYEKNGGPCIKCNFAASDEDPDGDGQGEPLIGSYAVVPQSAGASEGCSRDDGFVTAVVCDGSGQTDRYRGDVVICSEDDTEKPCMFYAQVDRGDRDSGSTVPAPVVVSLTQGDPGSAGSAAPAFPSVGDRVLLLRSGSKYFLHSVLPEDSASAGFDPDERSMFVNGRVLMNHSIDKKIVVWGAESAGRTAADHASAEKTAKDPSYTADSGAGNDDPLGKIELLGIKSPKMLVKFWIIQGKIKEAIKEFTDTKFNPQNAGESATAEEKKTASDNKNIADNINKHFTDTYESECTKAFSNMITKRSAKQKADEALASSMTGKVFQDGNKQSEEDLRKAAVDASYDLRKAYQEVDTLAGKIIGDGEMHIKDFCGNEHGVLNVNSGGDINITAAKGDIKIEATRVNEKNKTGEGQANNDITITADNITLKAGTIKLLGDIQVLSKVGGNSVAVAKNAIGLSSRKWSTTAGILDSSIALDSTTGVAVTGVNIGLNSIMSTVMGDSLGAKVICDGGSTTVSGNSISLASNTRLDAGFNVARFLTAFSMELTNVLAHQLDKESLGEAKDENGKTKKAEMNEVEKWSNIGAYALPAFVDVASWGTNQVISVLNTGIKTRKASDWITTVIQLFRKILAIVDKSITGVAKCNPPMPWTQLDHVGGCYKITPMDIVHIASTGIKLSLTAIVYGMMLTKMRNLHNASQSLSGASWTVNALNINSYSKEELDAITAFGGAAAKTKDDENKENKDKSTEDLKKEADDAKKAAKTEKEKLDKMRPGDDGYDAQKKKADDAQQKADKADEAYRARDVVDKTKDQNQASSKPKDTSKDGPKQPEPGSESGS